MEHLIDEKEIIQELVRKYHLYKRQTIAYEHKEGESFVGLYFKDMYEEYKGQYTEIEFAQKLHISKHSYMNQLIANNRIVILKKQKIENENELKEYLKKKYNLCKSITYDKLLEIYEEVKLYLTQPEVVQLLGIQTTAYTNLKRGKINETKINLEVDLKIDMEMIENLGKKYDLHKEQSIAYECKEGETYEGPYFKEMYEEYKDKYTEIEFAKMLGIAESTFKCKMKYGGKKCKILKNIVLSETEKEKVLEEIIKRCNLRKGQFIDDELFTEMHTPHKLKMSKAEVAKMIGISDLQLKQLKVSKAKILMNRELNEEEKNEILEKLIAKYNLAKKQLIKYEQEEGEEYKGPYFKEMHEEYKSYFTVIEFANLLQMFNKGDSLPIQHNGKRSEILVNRELTQEDKEKIRETIGRKHEGVAIQYDEENEEGISFKTLYDPYKSKATEAEFAPYIGVGVKSLRVIRYYTSKRTVIKDYIARQHGSKLIPKMESGFYSKEEIERILSEANMTLKQFIEYVMNKGRAFISDERFEKYNIALERNNGLYLGRMRMDNEYIEQNYTDLQRIARIISIKIAKRFEIQKDKINDLQGDILSLMIENYGDIVNNFKYDNNIAFGVLYRIYKKNGVENFCSKNILS